MDILSLDDATRLTNTRSVADFFDGPQWIYSSEERIYLIPKDSGAKVGLAKTLGNLFATRGPCLLWINEPHIWASAEQLDIFTRYRLSHGEGRALSEAPLHYFEGSQDCESLVSIMCISLFFVWGFEIAALDGSAAITVSHDEWLDYRSAQVSNFATEFKCWIKPLLHLSNAEMRS